MQHSTSSPELEKRKEQVRVKGGKEQTLFCECQQSSSSRSRSSSRSQKEDREVGDGGGEKSMTATGPEQTTQQLSYE